MYSTPNAPRNKSQNFGSGIQTQAPFGNSAMRQMSSMPPTYTGRNPTANALARGMADMQRNQMQQQNNDFMQRFQQQAESARSADVQSTREDEARRYALSRGSDLARSRIGQRREQGLLDIAQEMDLARKQQRQSRLGSLIDLGFGGALLATNPMVAPFMAPGLLGGLLRRNT